MIQSNLQWKLSVAVYSTSKHFILSIPIHYNRLQFVLCYPVGFKDLVNIRNLCALQADLECEHICRKYVQTIPDN